jgi:hypothetical protein
MMDSFRGELGEDYCHQIGLQREAFKHKLNLVAEGQHSLLDWIGWLEGRMDRLESRLDKIAVDLSVHRGDTVAPRKWWRVRAEEGGE